jgi:hypothetical protein
MDFILIRMVSRGCNIFLFLCKEYAALLLTPAPGLTSNIPHKPYSCLLRSIPLPSIDIAYTSINGSQCRCCFPFTSSQRRCFPFTSSQCRCFPFTSSQCRCFPFTSSKRRCSSIHTISPIYTCKKLKSELGLLHQI